MTDTDKLPLWRPRPDLNVEDLACTLEHIRRSAYMHWIGNAFDPQHMLAITNAAAQALGGEPIEAPVDMNSPQWREMIRERSDAWTELCDNGLAAITTRLDRIEAAAALDDDLGELKDCDE